MPPLDPTFTAPADKALAFLSKSLHDVRSGAETDLKLISSRAKSLQQMAASFDDWENIKLPSFPLGKGKDVTAGTLLKQLQDSSKALTRPLSFDDFDVIKKLEEHVKVPEAFSKFQSELRKPYSRTRAEWEIRQPLEGLKPFDLKPFSGKGFITLDEWNNATSKQKWQLVEGWEPLRLMQQRLKQLESSTSHKTPKELLEMVKKNLAIPEATGLTWDMKPRKDDVAPLGVSELFESLLRDSRPLLEALGVSEDASLRLQRALRSKVVRSSESKSKEGAESGEERHKSLESRIAEVMQSTGYVHKDGLPGGGRRRTVKEGKRSIAIVTTACLPWMTGTAVNPLLRAAYLASYAGQDVTLVVPWLSHSDQQLVYPNKITFNSPAEQEAYVREWVENRVGFAPKLKITFYPGKFSLEKRSILAAGDISSFVPERDADVAVLEEPEHLTWYYHGKRWTDKFRHVVGIIHTNYLEYVRREKNGPMQAFLLEHINNWMVRAYCHKVVRLSGATQYFPRSMVCNVHGVGVKFLNIGDLMTKEVGAGRKPFTKGAYYLGKMVWGKGYRELVDLLDESREQLGHLKVDVFGNGEDSAEVQAEAQQRGLKMRFHKGRDHADSSLHQFKVFINPSISDVVCTTTAEALAMGKIVVCADHPSNEFFRDFPNCLIYRTREEFAQKVQQALASEPKPLTPHERYLLSWEAATKRFFESADLPLPPTLAKDDLEPGLSQAAPASPVTASGSSLRMRKVPRGLESSLSLSLTASMSAPNLTELTDSALSLAHYVASGFEPWRRVAGAIPETMHIGEDLSKDLDLPPPWAQRPSYGW